MATPKQTQAPSGGLAQALSAAAAQRAAAARPLPPPLPLPARGAPASLAGAAAAAGAAAGAWQLAGHSGASLVLMPGQMYMGSTAAQVRTLLGSCVAITLWHPGRRIGGMCHFLLPQRQRRPGEPGDGRYGDEALEAMVRVLTGLRTRPDDYVAHLYGGADTMAGSHSGRYNVGERNIEQGWSLIDRYGFALEGVDVGEDIPRMVSMDLASGEVSMRRGSGKAPVHLK